MPTLLTQQITAVTTTFVQATFVLGTFVYISSISISKLNTFDFSLVSSYSVEIYKSVFVLKKKLLINHAH